MMSRVQNIAGPTVLTALSVVTFALLLSSFRPIGYALTGVVLAGVIAQSFVSAHAKTMPAQLLVTCGVLADAQSRVFGVAVLPMFAAALVIVTLVVSQPTVAGALNRPRMAAASRH